MEKGIIEYIVELITDEGRAFRILIRDNKLCIGALRRMARFILENNVAEINILGCRKYICNEEIYRVRVKGSD